MKRRLALLLAALFAVSPLAGFAAEKQVKDVKELAGSWQGWVTEQTQERANMVVQADGKYKASTTRGLTTEGQFYLQDGKLLYRSSRSNQAHQVLASAVRSKSRAGSPPTRPSSYSRIAGSQQTA